MLPFNQSRFRFPDPRWILAPLVLLAATAAAEDLKFEVLPREIKLDSGEARQRVSVVTRRNEMPSAMVSPSDLQWTVKDESVATIEGSLVRAVGNGVTELVVQVGDETRSVPIVVRGVEADHRWSFRNDVQSILAKAGCNAGACHGALAGKGGFKLSLRGYDSDQDFFTITREARGRRIELADPGRSLLLAKPTGALPHKGGLRLDPNSRDYQILAEWIASGAPRPTSSDARLTGIRVLPAVASLAPGEQSQILVQANYDDGRVVDVTHWAQYSSTDETVASVDQDGVATVNGAGEGAVLVWFGSKVALARMTVPFEYEVDAEIYEQAPQRNFIDHENLQQLQTLHLRPSPRCDDETFLRRSTLDTIGRLPTPEQRQQFLAWDPRTRRDQWIERLLASEDFVAYWAYKWSDLLLINGTRLRPVAVKTYYDWVYQRVKQNQPWDEFVREILTATGRSDENGATNFYALHQTPEEMTENACQAFMGLSIGCAKCHNHPLEKWTNDQYYSMANLFARVRAKGWGGDGRNGDGIRTLYVAATGDLIQPTTGKPQPPAPLDAPPVESDSSEDRREVLAAWMTDPDNPYFARAITNRVWANFFGRGLVESVDDLRLSNPASNESLLDSSSRHLVDAGFDLKQLMRTILQSETYQRSSRPLDQNRAEDRYHSRYYPKRLMAEVLLDSIDQVLETSTTFNEIAFPGADRQKTDFYDKGTRAIELYDAAVNSYFLQTFGRNPREITCECERSEEPSMVQVLHLSNGETLNPKLAADHNVVSRLVAEGTPEREIIDRLFVRALARKPEPGERKRILAVLNEYSAEERITGLRDAAWSILTSTEFTFNH
ncbi:DUF1553 domain-containing protein [Roseiconus nitratireducens]|uniref:DUF1553 domain-containing protein n=1 Tax=Roseiconus nitratireducens TaxID=2605748 RepID=A0A5M6DAE1_9BACT|nr:DUF1549 domain-containing protein [Roseiconus nitratireducens]KAA5543242.1 DUF1553 domain-containing protein [Roseiconus nitratireducens]